MSAHEIKPVLLVSLALSASASTLCANPLVYTNQSGGTATVYGQVTPAYVTFDDGEETSGNLVDNAHSNTRVGLFLDHGYGNGQSFRFNFETALGAPASNKFNQNEDAVWEWDKTKLRKIEVIFNGGWGRLSLGQGTMSTDGASSSNLSRTTIASSRTVADTAGGYFFRKTDGELSDLTISKTHRKWDGSRRMRVRYDTPTIGGTTEKKGLYFSAAYGIEVLQDDNDNTYYDMAARYEDSYGDWRMKASAGYGWIEGDDSTDQYYSGAFSALHEPSGLNGTIAGGADPDGGDFFYAKAGWIAKFATFGDTAMAIDYYGGNDTVYEGAESEKWGVHVVQYVDDSNLSLYLAYDLYSFKDNTGTSYQDASAVMAGLQWKF